MFEVFIEILIVIKSNTNYDQIKCVNELSCVS